MNSLTTQSNIDSMTQTTSNNEWTASTAWPQSYSDPPPSYPKGSEFTGSSMAASSQVFESGTNLEDCTLPRYDETGSGRVVRITESEQIERQFTMQNDPIPVRRHQKPDRMKQIKRLSHLAFTRGMFRGHEPPHSRRPSNHH